MREELESRRRVALGLFEEKPPDAAPLEARVDVELVQITAPLGHHSDDPTTLLRHPDLVLRQDDVREVGEILFGRVSEARLEIRSRIGSGAAPDPCDLGQLARAHSAKFDVFHAASIAARPPYRQTILRANPGRAGLAARDRSRDSEVRANIESVPRELLS